MADDSKSTQKSYHKKATGAALATVKKHAKEHELKLYGSCFWCVMFFCNGPFDCVLISYQPFVQRVWISLQFKGLDYQYIEVDPYKKPESLTAINPRGLVPALRHGDWGCYESTVLMEYVSGLAFVVHLADMDATCIHSSGLSLILLQLEDLNTGPPLLPSDPKLRAHCRLWTDHVANAASSCRMSVTDSRADQINRHITPAFYSYLQAQDVPKQVENATKLQNEISKLIEVAHPRVLTFLAMNFLSSMSNSHRGSSGCGRS